MIAGVSGSEAKLWNPSMSQSKITQTRSLSLGSRYGKSLDVGNCIVFELTDGRVVDGREHFNDLYAWDEFWS
jgi:hypothetical protein